MSGNVPDEFLELSGMLARAQESAALENSPEAVADRRRRRKRRLVASGTVALLLAGAIGTYVPLALNAPLDTVAATTEAVTVRLPEPVAVTMPQVGASAISVSGAEQFLGTAGEAGIFAAAGGNDPRPMASITKVVTALVILEAKPIAPGESGPMITFSKADADLYDEYYVRQASIWPMKAGSTMALREALEAMLVVSATNYADAVSRWAFGSPARFRTAARSWLDAHGLAGTTIVEPTGLDPRNLSTPTELIVLGKIAMANPVVAEIVAADHLAAAGGLVLPNTNEMLGVDGINGIKTGTLAESGACLLFSAVLDVGHGVQLSVIGVVLGGDNHYQVNNAVRQLLASLRSGFHEVPVLVKGQNLGRYITAWGEEASVVAASDASIFTWSDTPITSTVATSEVSTARSGREVGHARFVAGDETVTVPLELDRDIVGPDDWWRLTHPGELFGG